MSSPPNGWVASRLADVAEVRLGRQRSPKNAVGDRMRPYLRAANVKWDGLDLSDVKEMAFTEDESSTYGLRPGDLLLGEASGSPAEVGKPGQYKGEIDGCCFQNTLLRVRLLEGLLPDFYEHYFREQALNGKFATGSRGVGIHHLGAAALSDWQIPVAPTAEQERIVGAIEEAFSKLEAGEAGLRSTRKLLKRLREAILTAAVTGRLVPQDPTDVPATELLSALGVETTLRLEPHLPSGWACCALESVTVLQEYGLSLKAHEVPQGGDVPMLRMGNLQGGVIVPSPLKYVRSDAEGVQQHLLSVGDVLFNRTNSAELVGKAAVYLGVPSTATFASYLIRFRCAEGVLPSWCSAVINSRIGRAYIDSVAVQQVGQANVNGTKLKRFPIPLPPTAEQRRIMAEVERQLSFVEACERAIDSGLARSAALRRSVLKAAFAGRLASQDPADEPASILLERLRSVRSRHPPTRPRGRSKASLRAEEAQ